ncbi:hypothetical protein MJO28_009703 [Puccinia striiformis f. sp. tritici]|uniref:Uncharacterized protein n=1 Tax=Puccinia striiformis f. sp. tritici TaxID=168172 RepID=A0ACC0E9Z4_9BASI|nr:hypothetical protein MJO28_009703 [Puccinia striiformis f. sp. tritici]
MNNQPPRNNIPDDPLRIRQRRTVSAAGQFNLDPVPAANPPVRPANTAARFNPDINPPVRQIPVNVRRAVPPHIDPPVDPAPRDDRHRTDAEIDRNASTIINSTIGQIRDSDRLRPDGGNYPAWQDFICERIRDAINQPSFFDAENDNPTFERIVRSILINSLHESMRRHMGRLETARAMFVDLRARFHTISRAAQMNAFNNLLDFNATNFASTAEMAAHIEDALDEMEDVRVEFTRDHLAGLILQRGFASVPEVNLELNRRIEFRMEWTNAVHNPPAPALAMNAELEHQPSPPQLAETFAGFHPDNIPDAGDFMAMQAGLCWQCRSPDHMLRNCPLRQRPNQNRTAYRPPTNQFRQSPYNNNLGGGFQSYYPIITPPGFTGVYPQPTPVNRFNNAGSQPAPSAPTSTHRPADYYRPPQRQARPSGSPEHPGTQRSSRTSANEVSADPPTDESSARMVEIGDVVDDLNHLRFDHVEADGSANVPIIDSVATSGGNAFITGEGDLTFSGLDNQRVTIHGVLYCEHARSTLISLAALRKAKAYFAYDVAQDAFNIYTKNHLLVFKCPFLPKQNKWVFPQPILSSVSSHPVAAMSSSSSTQLSSNATSSMSQTSFCPVSTDVCTKLRREIFVTPLNIEEPAIVNTNSLTKDEKILLYWHRFFGHASIKKIRQIVQEKLVFDLPISIPKGEIRCDICARGKSLNKNRLISSDRPIDKLQIITADIVGFSEAKVMASKDMAAQLLMDTIVRWERQTSKLVGAIRTDNGGEFVSNELINFCTRKGIKTERALPYHHYQNGVIERYNRTLQEMGRTILIDSGMGKRFWGFAFIWACDTLNMLPNKRSGMLTPFEAFYNFRPSCNRQKIFGQKGYLHIPAEKRLKLDDRALEGRVVAHCDDSKGWIFLIKGTNQLIASGMVDWPDKHPSVIDRTRPPPLHPPSSNLTTEPPSQTTQVSKQPTTDTGNVSPLPNPPTVHRKNDISFLVHQLELGNFADNVTCEQQELTVDRILIECTFYAATVPKTFKQAEKSADWLKWKAAIDEELQNLQSMRVWSIEVVPRGRKPLKGRWVFAEKMDDNGNIVRYKARYVAKGFTQQEGLHSFDFVAAYLNSPIDEEVWVEAPEGLDVPAGHAMRLHKALYGTRQAARCWWLHLKNILTTLGFVASQYDNSLYTIKHSEKVGVIWVHVDDGIVTSSSDQLLRDLEAGLKGILKIKWSRGLESIVGLEIKRSDAGFQLRQPKLINQILSSHWDGVFQTHVPLPPNLELVTDPAGTESDTTAYLSVIGALNYLAVGTRPDIAYSVNLLARFAAKPGVNHWKGVRHLIAYLANSKDLFLNLFPTVTEKPLKCFCDASWGGELAKSTYGILVSFYGCPVLWTSRRFATVAASTCQAEYMALGIGTRQVLWVRHLLADILKQDFTGLLHCDNQAAIRVSVDDSANKRVRHVDREFYLTNQSLYEKKTELIWVPTKEQLADIFTKALSRDPFESFRRRIMDGV